VESSEEPGRREQNRRRTNDALVAAATRLFQEQGYDATTVRDIAAAAGVGERTFFRYFPSKESLLVHQVRETIPLLAGEIRKRPAGEPPLVALREAVLDLATWHTTTPAMLLVGPQPLTPDLASRGGRFLLFDLEEAVIGAFLDRSGIPEPSLEDQLRAAALGRAGVAALRSVRVVYTGLPEPERLGLNVAALVRTAFAALGV
jgi:AcrR family transcriptional regulator